MSVEFSENSPETDKLDLKNKRPEEYNPLDKKAVVKTATQSFFVMGFLIFVILMTVILIFVLLSKQFLHL